MNALQHSAKARMFEFQVGLSAMFNIKIAMTAITA
jgi:hypothetical protein